MISFSSPAAARFSMMDADALRMMELMGHTPSEQGALAAEDVPVALHRLRSAAAADHALPKVKAAKPPKKAAPANEDEAEETVSLSQRAFPLIDMLERAQANHKPVLWGM